MKKHLALPAVALWGAILASNPAVSQAFQTPLKAVRIANGLARPVYVTAPPGDTQRIFILEQFSGTTGRVRILNIPANTLNATPFLSIPNVTVDWEQGLLGLAFDPDYAGNGYFYVNYTTPGGGTAGHTVIARYTVSTHVVGYPSPNPDIADPASQLILKTIDQPETNHNGGCLQFGPDGMLYAGQGDGGGALDQHGPIGNGQNLNTLLGKLLRLDVNNPPTYIPADNPSLYGASVDEKWAMGLRNPWRFCFDRANGDLYVGDVGQEVEEEVDYSPFATAAGRNYGWRCREGATSFNCTAGPHCNCAGDPGLTEPIHTYTHGVSTGQCVIGGYVYRGPKIPDLHGTYFLADYNSGRVWSFKVVGGAATSFTVRTAELAPGGGVAINNPLSWGEDADGEMYLTDLDGDVFKIVVNCSGASKSFTSQPPANQNATAGQTVLMTVVVSGTRGLTNYIWRKDGNIVGADNAALQLVNVSCHDNGVYTCTVADQCGSPLVSNSSTLSVTPLPAGDIEGDCDCDLVDLDTLVNVLLGIDIDPGHVSRADVNQDGFRDGLDIKSFVDTISQWPC